MGEEIMSSETICNKCFNVIVDKNFMWEDSKPYHTVCYHEKFYENITHTVHKDMTPEKFRDNDHSVGMGTDLESFQLTEHLLELSKYYGIDCLQEALDDAKWFLNKKETKK